MRIIKFIAIALGLAAVFAGGDPRKLAAARLASAVTPEARRFLEFFAGGKRGFARPDPRGGLAAEES